MPYTSPASQESWPHDRDNQLADTIRNGAPIVSQEASESTEQQLVNKILSELREYTNIPNENSPARGDPVLWKLCNSIAEQYGDALHRATGKKRLCCYLPGEVRYSLEPVKTAEEIAWQISVRWREELIACRSVGPRDDLPGLTDLNPNIANQFTKVLEDLFLGEKFRRSFPERIVHSYRDPSDASKIINATQDILLEMQKRGDLVPQKADAEQIKTLSEMYDKHCGPGGKLRPVKLDQTWSMLVCDSGERPPFSCGIYPKNVVVFLTKVPGEKVTQHKTPSDKDPEEVETPANYVLTIATTDALRTRLNFGVMLNTESNRERLGELYSEVIAGKESFSALSYRNIKVGKKGQGEPPKSQAKVSPKREPWTYDNKDPAAKVHNPRHLGHHRAGRPSHATK